MKTIAEISDKYENSGCNEISYAYEYDQVVDIAKDYSFKILKELLKELYKFNRHSAGGQDSCVGVREAYGKNLIEIVEKYKHQLEE